MDIAKLYATSQLIRADILQMLFTAGSGHVAGSLGMADIFTCLYFGLLKHKPHNPDWESRDRLILSNGHICPVFYAALARAGYFAINKLNYLRQIDSQLQGHPHLNTSMGIENSSGPLGQGVSWAVGEAISAKKKDNNYHVICITSDGEQQEGQAWEAYMLATKLKLDNLIFILDYNHIQISGEIERVMPIEPLKNKLESFGLFVFEVDGHDYEAIFDTYYKALTIKNQPIMIIAHTIPGKGVSFMENNYKWHGKVPDEKEPEEALINLKFTI